MIQRSHAGEITFWPVQASDESQLDRVAFYPEEDRNRRSRRLCCKCRRSTAGRCNHAHLTTNQIGGECRQSIVMALGPAVFDRHILSVAVPRLAKASVERRNT